MNNPPIRIQCETCTHILGVVTDLENLPAVVNGACFGPPEGGYPDPFDHSVEHDWLLCPLCRRKAFHGPDRMLMEDGQYLVKIDDVWQYPAGHGMNPANQAPVPIEETEEYAAAWLGENPSRIYSGAHPDGADESNLIMKIGVDGEETIIDKGKAGLELVDSILEERTIPIEGAEPKTEGSVEFFPVEEMSTEIIDAIDKTEQSVKDAMSIDPEILKASEDKDRQRAADHRPSKEKEEAKTPTKLESVEAAAFDFLAEGKTPEAVAAILAKNGITLEMLLAKIDEKLLLWSGEGVSQGEMGARISKGQQWVGRRLKKLRVK